MKENDRTLERTCELALTDSFLVFFFFKEIFWDKLTVLPWYLQSEEREWILDVERSLFCPFEITRALRKLQISSMLGS